MSVEQGATSATSQFFEVKGSKIHYIEEGKSGDPMLFLHGMPASSYLWRNILPALSKEARCIAPDLIGMGCSDKPNINYTVFDHIKYIEGFIDGLKLDNITLVMHAWGAMIGLDYARRNPGKVKALVLFESPLQPHTESSMFSLPVQQLITLLSRPGASYRAIVEQNYLVEKFLPRLVLRKLTGEELDHYRAPFLTPESRKPLWQYIQDLPMKHTNPKTFALMEKNSQWLKEAQHPKLLMYAIPGFVTTMESVQWAREHIPNLTLSELGNDLHFAQETMPDVFCDALKSWYVTLGKEIV